ncbi:hypothetical protein WJX81_001895 [Elliptochloris bilobata]|uniref:Enoyl reductase (ER) domain-containing protein n=1 Tax=Elliptochloris bilobata TaxID=381761 RepID=A0AAW1RRD7_9CHLO
MTRISIPLTAEDAKAAPREFALLKQLKSNSDGTVDAQAFKDLVKKYGSSSATVDGDKLSFEEAAKLLSKTGSTQFPGEGNAIAYAAQDATGHLAPFRFTRRPVGELDIKIKITHCGICHSDLHQIRNDWKNSTFPMVPGHEIVGIVTEVGSGVTGWKAGDRAGIGCFTRACRDCKQCHKNTDQYCAKMVFTYNGQDWGEENHATQGGYSDSYVIDNRYALHVPENLPLDAAAPLLCAGITVWSPMMHYGINKPGMKLGVVGLGGLGHMAVKFGKALGMEVTVISTSPHKEKEAREHLGADNFIVSRDEAQMAKAVRTLDGIIDTVSAKHDISQLLPLLDVDGTLVLLGVPPEPHTFHTGSVLFSRLCIGGSLIGGIKETQEMLDLCGEKNITCDVEVIDVDYVNKAMERLEKNDVHYRFSIDMLNSLLEPAA